MYAPNSSSCVCVLLKQSYEHGNLAIGLTSRQRNCILNEQCQEHSRLCFEGAVNIPGIEKQSAFPLPDTALAKHDIQKEEKGCLRTKPLRMFLYHVIQQNSCYIQASGRNSTYAQLCIFIYKQQGGPLRGRLAKSQSQEQRLGSHVLT